MALVGVGYLLPQKDEYFLICYRAPPKPNSRGHPTVTILIPSPHTARTTVHTVDLLLPMVKPGNAWYTVDYCGLMWITVV